jgi:carbon-monoxide dehydrogenase iron sulfur subunit
MLQVENMSGREQILVVGDEPMICKSCKEILEDEGFFVDMAYTGEEGLQKGLGKKFDLVILDIRMPDISGMTLLKRMRAEQRDTPVVMITAYSTVESAVEAMKLGARDFVPKPFSPDELSQVVRSAIIQEGETSRRIPGELIIPKEIVQKALERQRTQAQYTVAVEIDKCIGCQMCMIDCAAHHAATEDLPVVYPQSWKLLSQSRLFVDLEGPQPVPLLCKQCETAPCATVCPTGSIEIDETHGFKIVDKELCIGCRSCQLACPFGLISMDREGKVAQKCDMCLERVKEDIEPVCVQICPRGALSLKRVEEAVSEVRRKMAGQALKANQEKITITNRWS